jgi:hypothetical protein
MPEERRNLESIWRSRMLKLMISSLGAILIVSVTSASEQVVTQKSPAEAPKSGAAVATSPAAKSKATTTPKVQQNSRRYNRGSNGSNSTYAGRTAYNYSGVGFPKMEGGLTAAANRTTWLKPMYPPHRRGRR